MTSWFDTFQQHLPRFHDTMVIRVRQEIPAYATFSEDEIRQRSVAGFTPFGRDLDQASPHYFAEYWDSVAYNRASHNIPLEALITVLMIGMEEIQQIFQTMLPDDAPQQLAVLQKGHSIMLKGVAAVYVGYNRYKDEIISTQMATLAEVSLPIVPIYEGILVFPLVGSIDTQRASRIMEGLLEAISTWSADVVIMDITGVPVIDTAVINYLLQAARAAHLLGSVIILVGTRAEIAQTIVQLGMNLTGIVTLANLQAGIEYALAFKNLAISHVIR